MKVVRKQVSPQELLKMTQGKKFVISESDGFWFLLKGDEFDIDVSVKYHTEECFVNEVPKPLEADGAEYFVYTVNGEDGEEKYGYALKNEFPNEPFYIKEASDKKLVLSSEDGNLLIYLKPMFDFSCCYDENFKEICSTDYVSVDADVDVYFVYTIEEKQAQPYIKA